MRIKQITYLKISKLLFYNIQEGMELILLQENGLPIHLIRELLALSKLGVFLQAGSLKTHLLCLAEDEHLKRLASQAQIDDGVELLKGKHLSTLSELTLHATDLESGRSQAHDPSIKPNLSGTSSQVKGKKWIVVLDQEVF